MGESKISVLIIGAGPAGLVNARTLLGDGFEVTIVAKEGGVGGQWASTYPDLATNSPWPAFIFSGLDMARPSCLDGRVVPARAYRRYLEDFHYYFVHHRAQVLLSTVVVKLEPAEGKRGWTAQLRRTQDGQEHNKSQHFDRVVLATGGLGNPVVPAIFKHARFPIVHSSHLADPDVVQDYLARIAPSSPDHKPTPQGDSAAVLVIGGGKSGMDMAALLASRGRSVVYAYRGPMKWFGLATPPGGLGANRLDVLFGPARFADSWTMWFYHCTWIGARWIRSFWSTMRAAWAGTYNSQTPPPDFDPHLALGQFAGGVTFEPTDFRPLVAAGKIAVLSNASPIRVDDRGVSFALENKAGEEVHVACAAAVAATGYDGDANPFLSPALRQKLCLDAVPPRQGWQANVRAIRQQWKTVPLPDTEVEMQLPLVHRGILPYGRRKERDFAVTGGTRPFSMPWISSLFNDDPFLSIPADEELLEEIYSANEYVSARWPGYDHSKHVPGVTYFVGFNDLAHSRLLLKDMKLDPWRVKNRSWWRLWDWLDVQGHPDQYATLGAERAALRRASN